MKGRTPTSEEREWMDKAGSLPCIACSKIGVHQPLISLHHIDGRTKPGAHLKTIPLCYQHHQGGSDKEPWVSVHPWKRRFEAFFGTQEELLAECQKIVGEMNDPVRDGAEGSLCRSGDAGHAWQRQLASGAEINQEGRSG